ncbi:DeoR/GlpR family DNA-binding transcription regulator [Fictibacillus phosphorivorans]|uniref:DeoR/GlpR family DNA-binding transcription regulator n=1 Tax=Fictibacillus phosphorivorans TaxID=1221500 RepID=UPI002040B640|nr:DeoR/GlpR family DNA-binding transcription regulator [Fictibacillus phosphorivorans]MCM3720175.1 DeoR/GlpR family DNA-binding transcription regulator [Fictibacillus phosphorivorans]MCM3777865.1 DeoR/GlpR family DNA-binding transcription regulator [Fictibacillus phosphorivorans]
MLTPERHHKIIELLGKKQIVTIQELVEATASSESTIRRDLSELQKEKKLKRVHGGASLLHQKSEELSVVEKSARNFSEKEKIAKLAATIVKDGDCIFIDAGTTTHLMIPHLKDKDITVVTNGISHLEMLTEHQMTTYLVGGLVKPKTKALVGSGALNSLSSYRFDKCFLGTNGIHLEAGFTTPDPEEASVKRLALSLSQETFILADHSKFNDASFSKVADLHEAVILTDELNKELANDFEDKTEIRVVKS